MGSFLSYENMLPSLIDARKRFLKDEGIMLPSKGRIFTARVARVATEMSGAVVKPGKKTANEA